MLIAREDTGLDPSEGLRYHSGRFLNSSAVFVTRRSGPLPRRLKMRRWYSFVSSVVTFSIVFLILATPLAASAHEAGGEQNWLISHYESGTLVVSADSSLPQWEGAKMLTIEEEGIPLNLMSINNGSFFLIMVQRGLNTSLDMAGVAIRFGAEDFNVSTTV